MNGELDVVIAGGGRVGFRTATLLDDRGHDVVVIERDPERCAALTDEYVATVIEGDATRPTVLEQTALDRTDAVLALTGNAGANLAVCMAAERLTDGVRTVMRTEQPGGDEYTAFVDAVVYPERAGARLAANAVEIDDVRAFEELSGDLDIFEVRVDEDAPVAGRKLADISIPRGSLVVSDAAIDRVANAEMVLEPGETYVLASDPDVTDEILRLFRG
jgi:trk system potassium uptake protein TrkA